MTSQSLITEALQAIGVISNGETPASNDLDACLVALQDLVDSWNTEKILIPALTMSSPLTLVTGTPSYTIGTGGVFNIARPIHIETAKLILVDPGATSTGKLRLPLNLIAYEEFAALQPRTAATTTPTELYNDYAQPLSTLYFWPIPTFTTNTPTVELFYWTPIAAFTALATTVTLAPGYQRALKYNLAVDLASMFGRSTQLEAASILTLAAQSKAAIATLNRQLEVPGHTFQSLVTA